MTRPLILVLGPGHSGTTILDAALGCGDGIVGIGEGVRMLDPEGAGATWSRLRAGTLHDIRCSCGRDGAGCPVWGPMAGQLDGGSSIRRLMPQLYDAARATQPKARYVLDSTPGAHRYLDELVDFDLRVVRLTRDVRSWAASHARRTGQPAWRGYWRWRRATAALGRALAARDLPCFTLGYEELALRPEVVLPRLCDWLEVPYSTAMLEPAANTRSHIVAGNIALKDPRRAATIRYDAAWMASDRGALLNGLSFAALARRNRALVYSNGVIAAKR